MTFVDLFVVPVISARVLKYFFLQQHKMYNPYSFHFRKQVRSLPLHTRYVKVESRARIARSAIVCFFSFLYTIWLIVGNMLKIFSPCCMTTIYHTFCASGFCVVFCLYWIIGQLRVLVVWCAFTFQAIEEARQKFQYNQLLRDRKALDTQFITHGVWFQFVFKQHAC